MELVGTGVELRLEGEEEQELLAGVPSRLTFMASRVDRAEKAWESADRRLEAQTFAEVASDRPQLERWPGARGYYDLPDLRQDPTRALLDAATSEREANLGGLLGELRSQGYDVTRWEFWALPFRVELSLRLRQLLMASWLERPPRQPDEPLLLTPR